MNIIWKNKKNKEKVRNYKYIQLRHLLEAQLMDGEDGSW